MKKSFKVVSLFSAFAVAGLTLASCMISINPGQTTTTTTAPAQTTTTTTAVVTDTEVETTPIEGGKYMLNNVVYDFNKANKTVKATKYETYAEYTSNTGTVVIDTVSVKFVQYSKATGGAVKFTSGNTDYYIYNYVDPDTAATKLRLDMKTGTGSSRTSGFYPLADLVQPTYGTFVSEKFTQDKVDAQGQRIPTGEGGYEKEDFYMFIELTATSAKVFVSDNNTTHGETPLYVKDNYDLLLQHARLFIRIPHNTEANYNCSIEFEDDTTIRVTNSYEKAGDYSCDGRFTKVE
ncbi:MAG: hypothetical protein IJU60_03740 [Acholeplasmatales bacterium]|nr:hypothetical protein [Acholeplasmatales bacterium]